MEQETERPRIKVEDIRVGQYLLLEMKPIYQKEHNIKKIFIKVDKKILKEILKEKRYFITTRLYITIKANTKEEIERGDYRLLLDELGIFNIYEMSDEEKTNYDSQEVLERLRKL